MIKIMLADDHEMFRSGIKVLLNDIEEFEVTAEAADGAEVMEQLRHIEPDVLLLDINMPVLNGIEATKKIKDLYPHLNILILSMYDDADYYDTLIDLGVNGFVLKESSIQELKSAINSVVKGKSYFSQTLLLNILEQQHNEEQSEIIFTAREKEIIQLMAEGLSSHEIGDKLFISYKTVERHRSNLLSKTNCSNSLKLVVYCIKHGLINL